MMRPILFVSGIALAVAMGAASLQGQAPTRTTNSGVYTAEQAERGKKLFEAKCTACHDTARFTGDVFLDARHGSLRCDRPSLSHLPLAHQGYYTGSQQYHDAHDQGSEPGW